MKLNEGALCGRLTLTDGKANLVNYIFNTQGADERRIDYKAAANSLCCCQRTIGRYVRALAALGILRVRKVDDEWRARLSPELILD